MSQQHKHASSLDSSWAWPINVSAYDRNPILNEAERAALSSRFFKEGQTKQERDSIKLTLSRFLQPIEDVLTFLHADANTRYDMIRVLLFEMHRRGTAFWAWSGEDWLESVCSDPTTFALRYGRSCDAGNIDQARRFLPVLTYLCHLPPDIDAWLQFFIPYALARRIFGNAAIDDGVEQLMAILRSWGYHPELRENFRTCVCYLLLRNQSPHLQDLTSELLETLALTCTIPSVQHHLYRVSRALHALGFIARALPYAQGAGLPAVSGTDGSVSAQWLAFCQRWRKQSTLQQRDGYYYPLLKVGRWLNVHHPEVQSPADWSYELAGEFIAAVNEMKIGEWSDANQRSRMPPERIGLPLHPRTKDRVLEAMRTFLRDCQEWGWIPVRLNPHRALQTPGSIRKLMGPDPRIIEKEVWAKLLWAGLNLRAEDCPLRGHHRTRHWPESARKQTPQTFESYYPLEMIRALAILWLFAGLRSDELSRLRVGCARMQTVVTGDRTVASTATEPSKPVCLLDIPVHKTGRAFTKPVDPLVGEAIAAWEAVRPAQPDLVDLKTGERVQFLFCYRAKRLSKTYLNKALIPALCQRAGVPRADARGSISSHRARSTIASQLFNAREPMTLFELQAWLGHQSPATTQHYVSTSPTKLAQAYNDAGYFSRNVRAIEVLIDQQAIVQGQAAQGVPWRYYNLGHGWCSYEFFDQCPHRMACARCDFYVPKDSARGQWLETRDELLKMLQEIPLSDEERAAVDGDIQALNRLLERLKGVPTPSECLPEGLQKQLQAFIPVSHILPIQTKKRV